MRPGLVQHTQLKQELKVNPRLYQAMDLLYMPLLDLQQHLKQELLNNPFLDMVEAEDEDDEEATDSEPEPTQAEEERKEKGDEIDWEEILLDGFDTGAVGKVQCDFSRSPSATSSTTCATRSRCSTSRPVS